MSTEISTQTQPRGLSLSTMDEAFRFSQMVAKSDFAPKDFRGKPESCLLAIQHGAEIGLSPMQSLQSIAVINGKPSVYGDTALAVCLGSSVCEYVRERIEGEGDAMTAICEAKRRGDPEPVVGRFSVADAKKASLWGKSGPWTQYSRRMLQMRARGFALRDAFPHVPRRKPIRRCPPLMPRRWQRPARPSTLRPIRRWSASTHWRFRVVWIPASTPPSRPANCLTWPMAGMSC